MSIVKIVTEFGGNITKETLRNKMANDLIIFF